MNSLLGTRLIREIYDTVYVGMYINQCGANVDMAYCRGILHLSSVKPSQGTNRAQMCSVQNQLLKKYVVCAKNRQALPNSADCCGESMRVLRRTVQGKCAKALSLDP
mmetsp:Transcript_90833/g.132847  ORF Transcript_90833/g.132847 Transcript_90833/m.132847 type:complete len:107 (-) Transcript_90833:173-493(-)